MTPTPSISAIIIALNEESELKECLTTLAFCDEIILVDGGSNDRTREIAEESGCKVITNAVWRGFGKQKQLALDHATSEWVLSVDSDERVTDELRHEILHTLKGSTCDGFYINRKTFFLGKWLKHGGWFPDRVLRLARRSKATFTDDIVHERLLVNGSTDYLRHPMLHFSYRTTRQLLSKQCRYALDSAGKKAGQNISGGVGKGILHAFGTFVVLYLFRLGFLDGRHGLVAAIAKSQEAFWKYAGIEWLSD